MNIGCSISSIQKQRFKHPSGFIIKAFFITFLLAGFFAYRFAYQMDFTHQCLYDSLHVFLFPVNQAIDKDPYLTVILVGQLFIDGFTFSMLAIWVLWCNNMKMPMFVIVFYGIRAIMLGIDYFPFPDNIVWRQPPLPTFMVPYAITRDFFFSGHTGLAMILTMQSMRLKLPKWVHYVGFIMIAWMPFMLISTRVHYTIDVLAAPFYVLLTKDINDQLTVIGDFLWGLPFMFFKKIKDYFCPSPVQLEDNKLVEE